MEDTQSLLTGTNIRKYCYSTLLCVKSRTTRKKQTFMRVTALLTLQHDETKSHAIAYIVAYISCFDKEHMYDVTRYVGNREKYS